jgi:hypothetical protein
LLVAQTAIEQDLKDRLGTLFQLDDDLSELLLRPVW